MLHGGNGETQLVKWFHAIGSIDGDCTIQVASHYINVMQAIQDERDDAYEKLAKTDSAQIEKNFVENWSKKFARN